MRTLHVPVLACIVLAVGAQSCARSDPKIEEIRQAFRRREKNPFRLPLPALDKPLWRSYPMYILTSCLAPSWDGGAPPFDPVSSPPDQGFAGEQLALFDKRRRPTREELLQRLQSRDRVELRESVADAVAAEREGR
ncbi:MAG: hypothetical protein DMF53_28885 [Acidobacteria bacterium]|nr:MAG: hypothetical protein DMF53_28885 [Acidobacteriota bacterium]